jgi:hypothetical protein
MKKAEVWKAKVAELKNFSEESLKQMEQDKEYLLRLLKDLEDILEMLQRTPSNPNIKIALMKYSSSEPIAFRTTGRNSSALQGVRVVREEIDLHKILADQKEKIPTYRSVISRFEHIGALLKTSLKRISEAETFVG